jgi:hypothetical protein
VKPPAAPSLIQLDDFDFGAPASATSASTADADQSLEADLESWEKEAFK